MECGDGEPPPAVDLTNSAATEPGNPVAVIGYPLPDAGRNPILGDVVLRLFGGYEAAAPGRITTNEQVTFGHNCSTTGGNSGSPVLDMAAGAVLGVHRGGDYVMGANLASHVDALRALLAEAG